MTMIRTYNVFAPSLSANWALVPFCIYDEERLYKELHCLICAKQQIHIYCMSTTRLYGRKELMCYACLSCGSEQAHEIYTHPPQQIKAIGDGDNNYTVSELMKLAGRSRSHVLRYKKKVLQARGASGNQEPFYFTQEEVDAFLSWRQPRKPRNIHRPERYTLYDVARIAGIGYATVHSHKRRGTLQATWDRNEDCYYLSQEQLDEFLVKLAEYTRALKDKQHAVLARNSRRCAGG